MSEIKDTIKVYIEAGKASMQPPVGPALGQKGIKGMDFCKKFNDMTQKMSGLLRVRVYLYKDDIEIKKANTKYFVQQELNIKKLAKGTQITMAQVKKIAEQKINCGTADDLQGAINCVLGFLKSAQMVVVDGGK